MKSCDKSRCQCGHVCILLCLHQLPGEALASWGLLVPEAWASKFRISYARLPSLPGVSPQARVAGEFAGCTPL